MSGVDIAFVSAIQKLGPTAAPSNGLKRFEFLEILVRLAGDKFVKPKIIKTYAEATEKILAECILVNFIPEPWQEFRNKQLWVMDVNDLFDANMKNLTQIYNSYKSPTKAMME